MKRFLGASSFLVSGELRGCAVHPDKEKRPGAGEYGQESRTLEGTAGHR